MFSVSHRAIVVLCIAFAWIAGCKSKTASPSAVEETDSIVNDNPQWIDVATAVPVAIAVRPDGRQVIANAPPVTHAYELPSGKLLHTWPHQVQVFYSGDGRSVLSVSDSVTSVSETKSFQVQQTFPSPSPPYRNNRPVFSAAISHDGSRIALTDYSDSTLSNSSGVVRVYERSSGVELLSIIIPQNNGLHSLQFLSDAKNLLVQYSRSSDETLNEARHLWDIKRSKVIAEFSNSADVIVSDSSDLIAVGKTGLETKITIYDAQTGQLQNQFQHPGTLNGFTFRPDSKQILVATAVPPSQQKAGSASGTDKRLAEAAMSHITQWDIATSKITFEQTHNEFPFARVMYDAEGERIFGALAKPTGLDDDVDYFLSGWNAKTSAPIKTLAKPFFIYESGDAFFMPQSDNAIVLQKPLSVRNIMTGAEACPVERYRIAQSHVQFKPNSNSIYSASSLINLRTGIATQSWPFGSQSHFVQDGRSFLNFRHPTLNLIDSESGQQFWNLYITCGGYAARDNKITSDAKYIVRSQPTEDDSIANSRLMIIRPDQPSSPQILHRYASRLAIHPSEQQFAAASDQSIEEIDFATGKLIKKVGDVPGRVLDMVYSSDGNQIAACGVIDHQHPQTQFHHSHFGWVWLYHCETEQVRKLSGHTAVVTSLAIDPPRNRLATSSLDGTLRLWDLETGDCLHVYRGHHSGVYRVAISSDGKLLVSAGADGIAVWNVAKIVDSDVATIQIAEKLTFVKTDQQPLQTTDQLNLSAPNQSPLPSPAKGRATWDVVTVGDTSRVHFNNRSVKLWLQENGKPEVISKVNEISRPQPDVPSAYSGPSCQSRDGGRLLFTDFREPVVKVFDSDYREVQSWPIRASERSAVISPDGQSVIIERHDNEHRPGTVEVEIYDVQSGDLVRTIQDLDARWGTNLKVDPLNRTVLVQFDNSSFDLREISTGKSLGILKSKPSGAGRKAEYSPDGRLIAMGKYPETEVQLCDPLSLKPLQTITNDLPVRWFKFTPDGTRLLVGQPYAESRTLLTMWQIDHTDLTKVRRLWSHAGPTGELGMFSDDGHHYLSPANWNMWTLWDTEQGHIEVAIITSGSNLKDHFVLSADGRSIHAYSRDGSQVWRKQ
ncbi:MAG: WD40 repeat domain-containing protein [Fuerstiella sp.]